MSFYPTAALVTIATPQFDRLVTFYAQLLNQQPVTFQPNRYAEFRLPGLTLGIFRPKSTVAVDSQTGFSPRGMAICLKVGNLAGAIDHLTQLGYSPPGDRMTASHGQEIYAFDPDGNWLILHQGVGE